MIQISNLTLAYGDKLVLDRFSLTLPDTGVTVLSGPSGCGKTTLMRCIAGLEQSQSGTISGIAPSETAFLFQEDRLFPWRTAEQHLTDVLPKPRRGEAALKKEAEAWKEYAGAVNAVLRSSAGLSPA